MFRLKVGLVFVLLFSALVLFAYVALQTQLAPALEEDAEIALRRTAAIAEKSQRLDEFALLEKARFVARRGDLHRAMTMEREGDAKYDRHMDVHKKLERDEIYFTQFMSRGQEERRNIDLDLLNRRPLSHELFLALDHTGEGVATLGKDLLHWYGDNIAREYPVVLDVVEKREARTDVWLWSFAPNQEKQLYSVALAPMIPPGSDKAIGVVILGNAIGDGLARNSQALLAGERAESDLAQARGREGSLAPQIAYFHDQRIYGSTFGAQAQRQLEKILFETEKVLERDDPQRRIELEIEGRSYTAIVRFFAGQYGTKTPSGLVVLTDAELARAPVIGAQKSILLVGAILLSLGLVLLLILVQLYLRPFDRLEQGVQEVLAGNKDHVFAADPSHDLAAGLAHQLNLLSAYLQGKPMPDDDEDGEGWDETGLRSTHEMDAQTRPPAKASPKVQGVVLPGMSPTEEDPSSDEEIR